MHMESTTCSFCHTPLPGDARFCMACGADFSDPETSDRQRAALKELFDDLKVAVEGRYRVTDMLGRGGMGAVFLAEDLRLGRRVALKVLRPELADDEGFVKRFEREARIAAGLDHPNIIPLYAVEQVGDFHYFTMKYVAGKSLEELLAGGPLPADQARRILAQAAAGLGHAHQRGVIHRDVKPPNLMLDEAGRVLITDFGISKALLAETQYTSTGQMVGTPSYLSPEQAQSLPVDGRSDQYSLACVGYRMVVGRLPLGAESFHAMMFKHIYEMPKPAREASPEVPADLSDALQRALAKDPAARFPSMEEFAAAVSAEAGPSTSVARAIRRPLWRRPLLVAASVAALLSAAAGVALWRAGRSGPVRPPALVIPDTLAPAPRAVPSVPTDTSRVEIVAPAPPAPPATPALSDTAVKRSPKPSRSKRVQGPLPQPPRSEPTKSETAVPSPRTGYLTVNAIPYGTVSVDGVEQGDTPIVRMELTPGQHAVRITREGYKPEVATATITAGNEVRLSRTLVRAP
jgi:serine/threonine protein kinase